MGGEERGGWRWSRVDRTPVAAAGAGQDAARVGDQRSSAPSNWLGRREIGRRVGDCVCSRIAHRGGAAAAHGDHIMCSTFRGTIRQDPERRTQCRMGRANELGSCVLATGGRQPCPMPMPRPIRPMLCATPPRARPAKKAIAHSNTWSAARGAPRALGLPAVTPSVRRPQPGARYGT